MDGTSSPVERTYTVLCPFGGIGLGALGFLAAETRLFGVRARFRCLGSLDLDALACKGFRYLTGAPAWECDVAKLTAVQLLAWVGEEAPDVVFMSPPCKSFSKLTNKKARESEKYKAMSRLVLDWTRVMLAAWSKRPPRLVLLENVPGIATLGKSLLAEVRKLLRAAGYVVSPGESHDCGELGGLAQHRQRYLLVARHAAQVTSLLYQPRKRPLKSVGEVLGPLPLPGDEAAGPLHKAPRISLLNWWRLSLIPPGGDWQDIPGTVVEGKTRRQVFRRYRTLSWSESSPTITGVGSNAVEYAADPRLASDRYGMNMRVGAWASPAWTVTGATDVQAGAPSMADPRVPSARRGRWGVAAWDGAGTTITGNARINTGTFTVADPRVPTAYDAGYAVLGWDRVARTIAGTAFVGCGAYSVADPRITCRVRNGFYGVLPWDRPAWTITGSLQIDNGPAAVSDPRVPGSSALAVRFYGRDLKSRPPFALVLPTADGTWHRPLTTLELLVLMGGPTHVDGKPVHLTGSSAKVREHIGNGVPVGAARAIAEQMLQTLVGSDVEQWALGGGGGAVWVDGPSREAVLQ